MSGGELKCSFPTCILLVGKNVRLNPRVHAPATAEHRNVSTFGLLLIAFFWVVGGIYGNEPLLSAGPPAYVFGLLGFGAIGFALPMALISAELACALPYDGGLVAWVCGKTVGAHNMYWLWLAYIVDSCAYPALGAAYVGNIQHLNLASFGEDKETTEKIVGCIIIALITLIKLGGTDYIVQASTIFFVMSMMPSTIFMVYGSKNLQWSALTGTDTSAEVGGFHAVTLFSWVSWLYCGFNSLGALAGEVQDPAATYPIVIGLLIPIAVITIAWPLAVAITMDPTRTNFVPGYFDDLAAELCGEWLRDFFILGAAFSFVGLYNAQIIICERSVASLFEPAIKGYVEEHHCHWAVRYMLEENGTGVAPVFILGNALLAGVFVWLPYETLIELAMLPLSLCNFLLMYVFLWYKRHRPEMRRPFQVGGRMLGGVCTVFPCFLITAITFYLTIVDPKPMLGIPYGKAVGLVAVLGLGLAVHAAWLLWQCASSPGHESRQAAVRGWRAAFDNHALPKFRLD